MIKLWHNLFLTERSSISLSLFRVAVALTTIFHVVPSFVYLEDTYFTTAFKTYNANFFPVVVIEWVQKSPEWLIGILVIAFLISSFSFFIGFFSQLSCIVMTMSCYCFYALNAFHIGTLSWDILLVTLFLMCCSSYHGDYFSIDALRRDDLCSYKKQRPFFIQRLLQLQIGFTFFYTALYKTTAQGNWLSENPIYYLMNNPYGGVVKLFLIRDFLIDKPNVCYAIGISIVVVEFLLIFLLFLRRTRAQAIYLGVFFHIILILTLDVPATFFFLFPAQLCLFINPNDIVNWIERVRSNNLKRGQVRIVYDGNCDFCKMSIRMLKIMDLYGCCEYVDFHKIEKLADIHSDLTRERVNSQMFAVVPPDRLYGGFYAIRRLSRVLPMLYILCPILYFPGMQFLGVVFYKVIAKNRFLLHLKPSCKNNHCYR